MVACRRHRQSHSFISEITTFVWSINQNYLTTFVHVSIFQQRMLKANEERNRFDHFGMVEMMHKCIKNIVYIIYMKYHRWNWKFIDSICYFVCKMTWIRNRMRRKHYAQLHFSFDFFIGIFPVHPFTSITSNIWKVMGKYFTSKWAYSHWYVTHRPWIIQEDEKTDSNSLEKF